jgi:poly-gamma-glutamate capsule biosynthesis protein CapA/YwtB (metallophosphatase superfamily)
MTIKTVATLLFGLGLLSMLLAVAAAQDQSSSNNSEIKIHAVGDIMLGTSYPEGLLPPNDGADELAEVAPILRDADLTFGNLEGPLLDGGSSTKCTDPTKKCFSFRVPTRYGKYLKDAGFDAMNLANNHALDFGVEGRSSSKAVLESLGIAHTGEVGDIAHLTIKGQKIAIIGFATYPAMNNLLNLEVARTAVTKLVRDNDIVIVSFHGGGEGPGYTHVARGDEIFLGEDRGDLRRFTHAMIDAGAAMVLGHGPHVFRAMEVYRNHLIVYSMGNFATYGPFNLQGPTGIAGIVEVRLSTDGRFLGGRIYPTKQIKPGGPRLDPDGAIIPILQRLSTEDFGENGIDVSSDGILNIKRAG